MLKMTIDNEEVVSDKDITINEEMLSASSTILNNVYPKEWEEDKDYTSKFYYPQDYSKALIQRSYVTQEAEAGTTIQVNGSVTLTDVDTTKNSRVLRLLGQTSQSGTPTPSSPIPVNVVSGDNEINVTGRNLLEGVEYGDIIAQTGEETTSTSVIKSKNYIPYYRNTTYYLSVNSVMPTNMGINLRFYNKNKEYIGYAGLTGSGSNFNITIVTSVGDTTPMYFRFRETLSVGPITSLNDNVMITTVNDMNYEPFGNTYNIDLPEGMELCKIGNYQDYFAKSDGRNLFDKSKETINTIVNSAGTLSPNNDYNSSDYIVVNPSESVVLSTNTTSAILEIVEYDENKTLVNRGVKTNSNVYTLTTNASTHFIRISYQNTSTKTQFEKGNTPTPWQPYGVGKWYLHKEIGKVVLDGSEAGWKTYTTDNNYFYYITNLITTTGNYVDGYCSHFNNAKAYPSQQGQFAFRSDGSQITFRTNITSSSNWTTWLGSNKPSLYYILATATNTEITYQPLIDQLNALSSQ